MKNSSNEKRIPFMAYRKVAQVLSIVLIGISLASLATQGLKLGLDFTGGTLVEMSYEPAETTATIRAQLEASGYQKASLVNFGSEQDVLVRLPQDGTSDLGDRVYADLQGLTESDVVLKRIEYVGPQVGEELREQGGLGLLIALMGVMLYVAFQFQFKFSVGAVVALLHDVLIALGVFSLLQIDFDLTVLAALLAVIGYSLNDTIVVSDRIRENFRVIRKASPSDIIDISLNQTLGRTLMTSATTLLVLLSLFFFGGEIIHGFSIALIVGVLIGTYSSIFVAASLLLTLNVSKEDLIVITPENADDGRP